MRKVRRTRINYDSNGWGDDLAMLESYLNYYLDYNTRKECKIMNLCWLVKEIKAQKKICTLININITF